MSKPKKPKPPGRPEGARNVTTVTDVEPSRCKKCGSSRRSRYRTGRRKEFSGQPYTAIIYRRCHCLDCRQQRVDREKVYPPSEQNSEENKAIGLITSSNAPAKCCPIPE
jgi:hypothetical protein